MAKTTIAGLLLVMLLVCGWTAEAAICRDASGNPIPCEQDPGGGGGGGGDPCSVSQKGSCESMTIYEGGYACTASWCASDPSAWFKCASHNTPTCEQGTGADGEPIYVQINDCAYCPD